MDKERSFYEASVNGETKIGLMVGKFCDPSYNDIELEFMDGSRRFFNYRDVRKVGNG